MALEKCLGRGRMLRAQQSRVSALLIAVALLTIAPLSHAAPITIFDTGTDDSGNLLTSGSIDPHYSLVGNPDGSGSNAYVVNQTGFPIGSRDWFLGGPNSQWLSPHTFAFSDAAGIYDWHTTFDLKGLD